LKVEAAAGGTIPQVCAEMATLAARVGISVQCNINGIEVVAYSGTTGEALYTAYGRAVDRKAKFAFA